MSEGSLALFGGQPLVRDHRALRIPWPRTNDDDRRAVHSAFDRMDFSGRDSPEIHALESEMSAHFGVPNAIALGSGTAALHAALFGLQIGPGDEVIVPNLTFVSTAMAVVHNGSTPVFADVDKKTFNISATTIQREVTERTRAVIVVHLHGAPADMDPIMRFCRSRNIYVIEDVAQAPEARYKGRLVGSIGDAAAFSLMAQKNLATCGEGGVLLCRDPEHRNRAELLRLYGERIESDQSRKYYSYTLGWNYTLNPIQAAMARTQLRRLPDLTRAIVDAALSLNERLAAFSWVLPPIGRERSEAVFHFYRVRITGRLFGAPDDGRFRQAVQDALNAEGLNVRHYQTMPVSAQPFFRSGPYAARGLKEYPGTLDTIRNTLILGAIGLSPAYLLCPGTPALYVRGFEKLQDNMDQLLEYASQLEYHDPWEDEPVLSDTFGASYVSHRD
jgi:perosamine synthetase